MLKAVVDPGVLIAALIAPQGTPANLVRRWLAGELQLIYSPKLIEELISVANREKFRKWFSKSEAANFVVLLQDVAQPHNDLAADLPPTPDPGDDYLVALTITSVADFLVTGDSDLRGYHLSSIRIATPRELLTVLDQLPS